MTWLANGPRAEIGFPNCARERAYSALRRGTLDWRPLLRDAITMEIRAATTEDADALWLVLAPTIGAGDAYALPQDMARDEALAWFLSAGHRPFVALDGGEVLGAYFYRANHKGGGSHVANAAFATRPEARRRGIASAMCAHAIEAARAGGFRAMQFNFVISTNPAVRLWQRHGFDIVGTLPCAFEHPTLGEVDAYVMYRRL